MQIVESDRNRFLPGAPAFLAQNEENSGVIDVAGIVEDAHGAKPVEGGPLYLTAFPRGLRKNTQP